VYRVNQKYIEKGSSHDDLFSELPRWNYDGSSTYQADGSNSDLYLTPVAIYKDPFRRGNNILVLCETFNHDGTPTESNRRQKCVESADKCKDQEPWFGIEQVRSKDSFF
jgi:glutamine synthetase